MLRSVLLLGSASLHEARACMRLDLLTMPTILSSLMIGTRLIR